jgi:hypothetical protein
MGRPEVLAGLWRSATKTSRFRFGQSLPADRSYVLPPELIYAGVATLLVTLRLVSRNRHIGMSPFLDDHAPRGLVIVHGHPFALKYDVLSAAVTHIRVRERHSV